MAGSAVSFRDVCFSYGTNEVLHNVRFEIEPGSFTGVVGPNGGGKTTLLKLMLGLVRPGRGAVTVLGGSPVHSRFRMGYVMQHLEYDAGFPVTVSDIVLMGRSGKTVFGRYSGKDRLQADRALALTGMENAGGSRFGELSGGQQQRVLIAQALAGEPEILLLDEPTANIDPDGEKAIHALLAGLPGTMTVISVSHNVNMVINSASHVLCVNQTASLSTIGALNPDTLAGQGAALLHHDAACHVFDHSHVHDSPHKAAANPGGDVTP